MKIETTTEVPRSIYKSIGWKKKSDGRNKTPTFMIITEMENSSNDWTGTPNIGP